jgi:hypothetical protein
MKRLTLYEKILQFYLQVFHTSSLRYPADVTRQSGSSHFHRSTSRSTCLRPLWSCKLTWPRSYKTSMIVQQNGAPRGMCLFQCNISRQVDWAWGATAWPPPSACLTPCGSWTLWCLYIRGPHQAYQVYEASLVGFQQNQITTRTSENSIQ